MESFITRCNDNQLKLNISKTNEFEVDYCCMSIRCTFILRDMSQIPFVMACLVNKACSDRTVVITVDSASMQILKCGRFAHLKIGSFAEIWSQSPFLFVCLNGQKHVFASSSCPLAKLSLYKISSSLSLIFLFEIDVKFCHNQSMYSLTMAHFMAQ